MKLKIHPFWLYLIAFVLLIALYVSRAHSFLAVTNRVQPQVLLVEGWLEENYFEAIAKEIKTQGYEKVITTGGSLPNEFRMHTNGGLIYQLNEIGGEASKNCTTITLTCRGTEAYGIYPQVNVWADSVLVANFFAVKEFQDYMFHVPDPISTVSRISIEFTNDDCEGLKDRNLYVKNLLVDGVGLGVRRNGVYYDRGIINGQDCESIDALSYADQAKKLLIIYGIDESWIISIPSETVATDRNRTLSHALSVRKWKESTSYPLRFVTIFTNGTHARRSLMIYRRVLGNDVKVGVISIPSYNYDPSNWWKSNLGVQSVIYETIALVYYWAIMFFV